MARHDKYASWQQLNRPLNDSDELFEQGTRESNEMFTAISKHQVDEVQIVQDPEEDSTLEIIEEGVQSQKKQFGKKRRVED